MLIDPIKFPGAPSSEVDDLISRFNATNGDEIPQSPLRLLDLGPGSSVRGGAIVTGDSLPGRFSISHSETKENKPFTTTRTVIRLDRPLAGPDGVTLNTAAYIVVSVPTVPTFAGPADGARLAQQLAWWILFGSVNEGGSAIDTNRGEFLRVLQGEP
jgi:hypothetical protein